MTTLASPRNSAVFRPIGGGWSFVLEPRQDDQLRVNIGLIR